jgi:hypothetical protein
MKIGCISSVDDYTKRPDLSVLTRGASLPSMVDLTISHKELEEVGLDFGQLELHLGAILKEAGIGNWVESGVTEDHRQISFNVQPKKLKQFSDVVQDHLRSLGIRRYRLFETESGKEID